MRLMKIEMTTVISCQKVAWDSLTILSLTILGESEFAQAER